MSNDRNEEKRGERTPRTPHEPSSTDLPALRVFARLTLSYQGVQYKTQWLEYPDIAPTLKAFGLERNRDGNMPYSIPAIRFEDNGKALESSKIVHELEKRYPTPSPKINDEVVQEVVDAVIQCMRNGPDVLPKVPRVLLDPKSAEYFEQSRSQKFGMSLDQLQKEKGGSSWDEAELGFKRATELLKENRDGPYFMGKKVSYADFVFASLLKFLERADRSMFEKALGYDPVLRQNYEACAQWFSIDSR